MTLRDHLTRARNTAANYLLTIRPFARRRFVRIIGDLPTGSVRFMHSYMLTDRLGGANPKWMVQAVESELVRRGLVP